MFARALSAFVSELALKRCLLVHLHISQYGSFFRKALLAWMAKAFCVPVVLHIHGSKFHNFFAESSKTSQFIIRSTLESADAVLALGDVWADRLRAIAPLAKITVLPNAVRPDIAVRQEGDKTVGFVFLGEVGERKGTFALLEAWARMLASTGRESSVHLTIAGDGDIGRAKRVVDELGLAATVDIRGWIAKSEARDLLSVAKVLVLPSRNEGQPMAILEAMAQGLCVIASDVGGIPEMLRGGAGILVKPDDVDELSKAISLVVADPAVRASCGRNAIERIHTDFNLDVLSSRLEQIYRDLTS